jgi:hypothetical protein
MTLVNTGASLGEEGAGAIFLLDFWSLKGIWGFSQTIKITTEKFVRTPMC